MPKAFPEEFRRDAVAAARMGESLAQIAKDFGVSPAALASVVEDRCATARRVERSEPS